MTNEELEKKVKRLEEEFTKLRIELLENKVDKKSYEVEVPEDIENYYYVSESGDIDLVEDVFFNIDYEGLYQRGLAFKTVEETKQYDRERILLFRMHKWAEEHNEGWTPDWEDFREPKYTIAYEYRQFVVSPAYTYQQFLKVPYFKTKELAEQFIDEFGEEIKEVFC